MRAGACGTPPGVAPNPARASCPTSQSSPRARAVASLTRRLATRRGRRASWGRPGCSLPSRGRAREGGASGRVTVEWPGGTPPFLAFPREGKGGSAPALGGVGRLRAWRTKGNIEGIARLGLKACTLWHREGRAGSSRTDRDSYGERAGVRILARLLRCDAERWLRGTR